MPGDVIGFDGVTDIVHQNDGVWRCSPLPPPFEGAFWTTDIDGRLDPPTFAKFQKVIFDAKYHFIEAPVFGPPPPSFFVGDRLLVHPEGESTYISYVKKSRTTRNLAKILSRSPLIKRLTWILDVSVQPKMSSSRLVLEKVDVADRRARELFLDAGMLDPLRELSNVRSFNFDIRAFDRDGNREQLRSQYAEKVREVKGTIERNYTARQVSS